MKKGNKIEDSNVLIIAVLILSFLSLSWTISVRNGLIFDDYSLLSSAMFNSYESFLKWFPDKSYNDRSFRMIFLKVLIELFDDNYVMYHFIFVIIHLINVFLVYLIASDIYRSFESEKWKALSIITSSIFGIWPNSQMAVQWISSTCDFQCCNFMLFSIWAYLKHRKSESDIYWGVISFLCYWSSLRCKEMSLPLPVIIAVYEVALFIKNKSIKKDIFLIGEIIFMLIYAIILFGGGQSGFEADNPYYLEFSIVTLIVNFFRYIALYFDITNSSLSFRNYSFIQYVIISLFCILVFYTVYEAIIKKRCYLLLAFLTFCGSIVVVLPMKNMQHRLYLYLPSVFLAFFLTIAIDSVIRIADKIVGVSIIVVILCTIMYWAPGPYQFRMWWLSTADQDSIAMESIEKLQKVPENTRFYVKNTPDTYNIFTYGPGHVFNLLFKDETITCELVSDFPTTPNSPYVFLEYKDNSVMEVERNGYLASHLSILYLSKYEVLSYDDTEDFIIGIWGNYEYDDLRLLLNGEEVPFSIGEDFITFIVPENMREPGNIIKVKLYSDDAGGESNTVEIKVK